MDLSAGSQERDPSIRLAGSYVNFLIVNGGIIAPKFDDAKDTEAEAKGLYPTGRKTTAALSAHTDGKCTGRRRRPEAARPKIASPRVPAPTG